MPNPSLTASQIAAQAAMQHQQVQHSRQRSQTVPNPHSPPEIAGGRRNPNSPPPLQPGPTDARGVYHNGLLGSYAAATSAANAAFPRSAISSPGLPGTDAPLLSDKEHKQKSKMKLFSKPRSVGISKDKDKDKDIDRKDKPLPSPKKINSASPLPRMNPSSVSLADSLASSPPSSLYYNANSSTSTLQPPSEKTGTTEKHKHYFLSRQKHKAAEREEHHHLPLSSASSNSKPRDPLAPQSLYSFAPSSPGPSATSFAKSMSGLDLRHGGRALREKKKEEKASAAASAASGATNMGTEGELPVSGEWPGPSSLGSAAGAASFLGAAAPSVSTYSSAPSVYGGDIGGVTGLQGFGLHGMTPDDAWPFLKAKLLVIFEDEDLRLPVEDFNRLVK
jgi:HbrB-like